MDCRNPRRKRTSDVICSVRLSGGVQARGDSPLSAYVPKLRRYLSRFQGNGATVCHPEDVPGADGPVKYKDVVTTWKGLSLAQAEEIICWEVAFQAVIEDYVAKVLEASFKDSYPQAGT